jgi:hypothetical protein
MNCSCLTYRLHNVQISRCSFISKRWRSDSFRSIAAEAILVTSLQVGNRSASQRTILSLSFIALLNFPDRFS